MIIAKSYSDDFVFAYNEIGLECSITAFEISNIQYQHEMMAIEAYRDCNGDTAVLESNFEAIREASEYGVWEKIKDFFKRIIEKLKNLWLKFKVFVSKLLTSNKKLLEQVKDVDDNKEIEGEFFDFKTAIPRLTQAHAIDERAKGIGVYIIGSNADPAKLVKDVSEKEAETDMRASTLREQARNYFCGKQEQRKVRIGDVKQYVREYDAIFKEIGNLQVKTSVVFEKFISYFKDEQHQKDAKIAYNIANNALTVLNEASMCSVRLLNQARSILKKEAK